MKDEVIKVGLDIIISMGKLAEIVKDELYSPKHRKKLPNKFRNKKH